jgi:alanine-synthesizing transaminase
VHHPQQIVRTGRSAMDEFYRIKRLPPYVFAIVNDLKTKARARGEDVIDLGMGNPDMPTPKHIVAKLVEAAQNPKNHRYSASRGITRLRKAMTAWYRDRYAVDLDPDSEVIATIGAKEGMAHLALAVLQPGDGALVPNPTYPIHSYSVVIADGDLRSRSSSRTATCGRCRSPRTATSSRACRKRRSSPGQRRSC